jgi:hypothetical protein
MGYLLLPESAFCIPHLVSFLLHASSLQCTDFKECEDRIRVTSRELGQRRELFTEESNTTMLAVGSLMHGMFDLARGALLLHH